MGNPEKITSQRLRTGTRLQISLSPNHLRALDAQRTCPRRRDNRDGVAIGRVANQGVGRGSAQFQHHLGTRGVETRIYREHRRRHRRPQRNDAIGSTGCRLRLGIHRPLPSFWIGRSAQRLIGAQSRHHHLIYCSSNGIAQRHRLAGGIEAKIRVQLVAGPNAVETRRIDHEGLPGLDPPVRESPSPRLQRVI